MNRRHNHARRTDAALRSSAFKKRLLYRVQNAVLSKPLDRAQSSSLGLEHGNQAAIYQFTIHEHGAGTALSFAAALFGSGKAQFGAQDVEQPLHGINRHGMSDTIHGGGAYGSITMHNPGEAVLGRRVYPGAR